MVKRTWARLGNRREPVRGERLRMFAKCAHVPEGKQRNASLVCPGPSSSLLVTESPCPALGFTWCTSGLVPAEVVPESARQKEVITGGKTLQLGSRSSGPVIDVTWTSLGALKYLACCLPVCK